MSFTRAWSDAIPVDHTLIPNVPSSIRAIRVDLEDRLAGFISGFAPADTLIGIVVAPFIAQSTPTPVASQCQIYGKQFNSKTELTFQDEDSHEIQITKGGKLNSAALSTAVADLAAILAVIFPIGSTYCNVSNSTNPATLFGFGTWTALQAIVLAGYKSGDANFGTAGATIGATTHTLTQAELPAGSLYLGGATHVLQAGADFNAPTSPVQGSGTAFNIIQPSLTVYMWQRTA